VNTHKQTHTHAVSMGWSMVDMMASADSTGPAVRYREGTSAASVVTQRKHQTKCQRENELPALQQLLMCRGDENRAPATSTAPHAHLLVTVEWETHSLTQLRGTDHLLDVRQQRCEYHWRTSLIWALSSQWIGGGKHLLFRCELMAGQQNVGQRDLHWVHLGSDLASGDWKSEAPAVVLGSDDPSRRHRYAEYSLGDQRSTFYSTTQLMPPCWIQNPEPRWNGALYVLLSLMNARPRGNVHDDDLHMTGRKWVATCFASQPNWGSPTRETTRKYVRRVTAQQRYHRHPPQRASLRHQPH